MRIKAEEMLRALDRPTAATRFFLLTGPDEGAIAAVARRFSSSMGTDAERIDLDSAALKGDPARLSDEAAAISLFGGPRWIQLTIAGSGDDCADAVTALLEAPAAGNPVIATGPGVSAKSRLIKLVDAAPNALSSIHYELDAGKIDQVASQIARELHLKLAGPVARKLCEMVGSDREIIRRELEKIATFLDASPETSREVTAETLGALGAENHEEDINRCIDVALGGAAQELAPMLAALEATALNEIRLIRAMGNRVRTIAKLRPQVDRGRGASDVTRDRANAVFFKEQASVARQLAIWDAKGVARLIDRLQATERAIKSRNTPGGILMRQLLVELTREAAKRRSRTMR